METTTSAAVNGGGGGVMNVAAAATTSSTKRAGKTLDKKGSVRVMDPEKVKVLLEDHTKDENYMPELDSESLSRMVKDTQVVFLAAQGGPQKLAANIGCLDTNSGLPTTFDFNKQREKYGKNDIDKDKLPSYCSMIWEGLHDVTILMLIAAATVSIILALGFEEDKSTAWIEGVAIYASVAIVLNVQAATEYSKSRSFRKQQLSIENSKQVNVIRGGISSKIHPRELVVGDVIRVSLGEILQADGLILDGFSVKMDESALTGESKLMPKIPYTPEYYLMKETKKDESPFMLSGTSVMDGQGRMLVVAVGINSIQGKILAAVSKQEDDAVTSVEKPKFFVENKGTPADQKYPENPATDSLSTAAGIKATAGDVSSSLTKPSVAIPKQEQIEDHHHDHDEELENKNGCCTSCKACWKGFFTFSMQGTGGTLMEKLDHLAISIGKIGILTSLVVFVVLIIRFCVQEYGLGGPCPPFDGNEAECTANASQGCYYDSSTSQCNRGGNGSADAKFFLEFFLTAVTILVVAVPEGLPLAVTLSLAISMRRMAHDNNQVKHLDSCETMGSATTICSDKTGTLTENRMTVMRISFGPSLVFEYDSKENKSIGDVVLNAKDKVSARMVKLLTESIALNTLATSSVVETSPGVWKYEGNATECALLKLAKQLGYDPAAIRKDPVFTPPPSAELSLDWGVYAYPFSSSRKRMSWVVKNDLGYRLFSKGAPNAIFDASKGVLNPVTLTVEPISVPEYEHVVEDFQNRAMRAIALAYKDFDDIPESGWDDPMIEMSEMIVIGVVGIEDPLRPAVIKAIGQCNSAGIDVRMCTGDALPTAVAISKQCAILRPFDLQSNGEPKPFFAMTGAEFDERVHILDLTKPKILRRFYDFVENRATDALAHPFLVDDKGSKVINQRAFDSIWPKLRVMARCQPEDKLTLVRGIRSSKVFARTNQCEKLLKEHNIDIFPDFQVVAVTGDGTNDAPALKSADVGFAMGIVGTDIAKAACDIVLLDDNFASIVAAVKWGRNVFDAISKFIQFQLSVNVSAITLAAIGAFAFGASPLRAVQMLWVNLIMDSLASIALATEQPSEHLLTRKPYGKRRAMISRVMMFNIFGQSFMQLCILFGLLFDSSWIPGDPPEYIPDDIPTRRVLAGGGNASASVHWTVIFNTFVMMTLANQINSRNLPTVKRLKSSPWEWCVFVGMHRNWYFLVIMTVEFALQVIIIQFGGEVFTVVSGGLTGQQWGFCIGLGLISWPWQLVIYTILILTDPCLSERDKKKKRIAQAKLAVQVLEDQDVNEIETRIDSEPSSIQLLTKSEGGGASVTFAGDQVAASGNNSAAAAAAAELGAVKELTTNGNSENQTFIDTEEKRQKALARWKVVRMHVLYGNAFQRPSSIGRRPPSRASENSAVSGIDNLIVRGGTHRDPSIMGGVHKQTRIQKEERLAEFGQAYLSGEKNNNNNNKSMDESDLTDTDEDGVSSSTTTVNTKQQLGALNNV